MSNCTTENVTMVTQEAVISGYQRVELKHLFRGVRGMNLLKTKLEQCHQEARDHPWLGWRRREVGCYRNTLKGEDVLHAGLLAAGVRQLHLDLYLDEKDGGVTLHPVAVASREIAVPDGATAPAFAPDMTPVHRDGLCRTTTRAFNFLVAEIIKEKVEARLVKLRPKVHSLRQAEVKMPVAHSPHLRQQVSVSSASSF